MFKKRSYKYPIFNHEKLGFEEKYRDGKWSYKKFVTAGIDDEIHLLEGAIKVTRGMKILLAKYKRGTMDMEKKERGDVIINIYELTNGIDLKEIYKTVVYSLIDREVNEVLQILDKIVK